MADDRVDDAIGVVAAGGRSSRFGRDKALEPAGGVPMALRVYRALAAVIRDVRVGLARPGERNPVEEAAVIYDEPADSGPAGSLRAALEAAGDRWVFFAACDMPGLVPGAVRRVLAARSDQVDVVVPVDSDGRLHPLAAAWHPRALPALDLALSEGRRSLTSLAAGASSVVIPVPDEWVVNVNRPGDARFASGPPGVVPPVGSG